MEGLASWLGLADYNTQIAMLGAACLGVVSGLVGTFLVVRRSALIADTLGHSTLPGIVIAFLLVTATEQMDLAPVWLLVGAVLSGGFAAWLVAVLQRVPRIHEDAAMASVLGVLFGLGLVLLGILQRLGTASMSGLDGFMEGSLATITAADAWTTVILAAVGSVVTLVLFRQFTLMAFDPELAQVQGLPIRRLEAIQMVLVVLVTVAGLRAVGLILMIAMLVIPSAAARRCSHRVPTIAALAAAFGTLAAVLGTWISAVVDGLPTGAVIVLVATLMFFVALVFGPAGRSPRVAPAGGAG